MKLSIKLLNLAGLLLAVAWLARSSDWEPAITSIGLLVAFLGQEIFPLVKKDTRDKDLANKFLSDLPSNSRSINFLRDHDVGVPYKSDVLNELDEFIYNWDDAEHEFSRKSIEKRKQLFFTKAKEYRNRLSMSIYPHHSLKGFLTMDLKDYETDMKKLELRDSLNEEATKVFNLHQDLVRQLNKVL